MANVMHILDASTPPAMRRQLRLLRGPADLVVALGPNPDESAGLEDVLEVHVPLGRAKLALHREQLLSRAEHCRVYHAWSRRSAELAEALARKFGRNAVLSLAGIETPTPPRELAVALVRNDYDLTVPNEYLRRELLKQGVQREALHVLPPAAELQNGHSVGETNRRQLRRRLGLNAEDFVIVAPGQITDHSGHRIACWAHAMLTHIWDRVKLVIPGHGPAMDHLEFFDANAGAPEATVFTHDRIPLEQVLFACDAAVIVQSRPQELTGLAASMAAGLPCVCSDLPNLTEWAIPDRAALVVPPDSPQATARQLLHLVDTPELRRKLGQTARRIAEQNFSPEHCRRQLAHIYAEVYSEIA
ncbi:MAG: glycosyltransferase family 4 protein [Phycisphaerae bacterium]